MIVEIIIVGVCVFLSAFFSGMEIAFVSANKLHIELEKKREGLVPRILSKITEKPSKFITTMLVGNNITLVIYSFFMGDLLLDWFSFFLPSKSLVINYLLVEVRLVTQTVISTLLILLTAEFLPKAIFRIYANETLKFFAIPVYVFYVFFYYLTEIITIISDFLLEFFFKTNQEEKVTEFSKEELGNYISEQLETTAEDQNVDTEIHFFQNALDFEKVKAREIMVPRTEVVAIDLHQKVSALQEVFLETGFSKVLVYKNSLDNIIGYVSAFELFKKPKSIRSILLPVEIVPETMLIADILNSLTQKRKSLALVVDEYGGTSGIITVEDIIEELFGEIEDEHDHQSFLEEKINDFEFKFSARLEVDYLNEKYNIGIPKKEGYETLGGFVIYHTENIPSENDVLTIGDFQIEILNASATKIETIYCKLLK